MPQPSFLARKPLGVANYLLIAIVVVCCATLIPPAARRALKTNRNRAEDWLPATARESRELSWFRKHFASDSILVCTWDGCTLGNDRKLRDLTTRLVSRVTLDSNDLELPEAAGSDDGPSTAGGEPSAPGTRWFRRLESGPSVIDQLTSDPLRLNRAEAARRLEGSLVGPRRRDSEGKLLGDASRQTCLVICLASDAYRNNSTMRQACAEIERVACDQCDIPRESFRLVGAPVDNIAIDATSRKSFGRVSTLTGIMGLLVAYGCFRSIGLTGIVVLSGWLCSGLALALVFLIGTYEMRWLGLPAPRLGTLDAVTMTMPALVYVLGISGAVHIVNYYLDARRQDGTPGAAERAVRVGWTPCFLAAVTTSVGLVSLATSDIVPIQKFGTLASVAVLASLAVLFSVLPVFLHRFPPKIGRRSTRTTPDQQQSESQRWHQVLADAVIGHHGWIACGGILLMLVVGSGLARMESSVQVLKLLDPSSRLIANYAWIEKNLGNVVPMELVITIPAESCRGSTDHAEASGRQYRMTMLERLQLIRRITSRIERMSAVSRTMSVATFGPGTTDPRTAYTVNQSLEEYRLRFDEYLKIEDLPLDKRGASRQRELWRITTRVSALQNVDYGVFASQLEGEVEPLLDAYRVRDQIVGELASAGKRIDGAHLTLLCADLDEDSVLPANERWGQLAELLRQSGIRNRREGERGQLTIRRYTDLDLERAAPEQRKQLRADLQSQEAVLLAGPADRSILDQLRQLDILLIDLEPKGRLSSLPARGSVISRPANHVEAVYTGIVPLVFKTQRQLLVNLRQSILLAALVIAVVMSALFGNVIAGLLSMVPNVFPLVVVFGGLSWLGIKVDVGIMMSASVALGVAVDDTVHFLTWFRRGASAGLDRREATRLAIKRCAAAMTQTTTIAGLGLAMFVASPFMPTQRFGLMMVMTLVAALVGDLLLLPALTSGPLGRYFIGRRTSADARWSNHSLSGENQPCRNATCS